MPLLDQIPAAVNRPTWNVVPNSITTNADGQLTVQIASPEGVNRTVVLELPSTMLGPIFQEDPKNPGKALPNSKPSGQIDYAKTDFTVAQGPEDEPAGASPGETNARIAAAQAQATSATAAAAKARQDLDDLQKLDANRSKNVSSRNLYMTDEEIAVMDKSLRDQGLQQSQIDAQLKIAADNNKQAAVGNQIAAMNAATAASRAAHDAKIDERRVNLEENKNASDVELRQAQLDFDKEEAALNRQLAQDKLALDSLTQRQTNEVNQARVAVDQGNLAVSQGSAAETGRSNLAREEQAKADAAQRAAETKQTAETAERTSAISAASGMYSAERQAQSSAANTGASLINQRIQSAQGMLNGVLGLAGQGQSSSGKFGPLGGGLHAMPAGFDATQLLGGIQGYTAELGGGQQVYDAAARMVQQAGGDTMSPQGQAAYGVLSQMLERFKALTGTDHPAAAASAAAAATGPATGVASPATTGAPVAGPAAGAAVMGGAAAPAPTFASPNQAQPSATPQAAPVGLAAGQRGAFGITPEMAAQFQAGRGGQGTFVSPPSPTIVINA